jgi:hypothetical protein
MLIYAEEQSYNIDIDKYQKIIFTIITNLDSIMGDNKYSEIVYNTYLISKNAVHNNKVTFKIDPRLESILGGLSFSTYESGEISLVFGLEYLDTYYPGSSIHYSILIHEYRHLHDYITDKTTFMNAHKDEKELYWFEMDAIRIEAEFIKYYLVGKYNLCKFEEYILYSFENNNLNTASIFLKKESWSIFWYFNDMENKFMDDKISKGEIIINLEQNGRKLINNYHDDANEDYLRFIRYIEISTFRKYLIRIFGIIINKPGMTWGEVFEQYPGIEEIYKIMSNILDNDNKDRVDFLDALYQFWENDIANRKS